LSLSIFAACCSWIGNIDSGVGSLHIAVRRVLLVGSGTGIPGDHTIMRFLESIGTYREEDHVGEEHVPDANRRVGPNRGHVHEYRQHHLVKEHLWSLMDFVSSAKDCTTKLLWVT